jgi:cysteine-rich repeat protein
MVTRVVAALSLVLAAGCNTIAGIEPPIADPCLAEGGGGCVGSSGGHSVATGKSSTCGDGIIDPGEECDDGDDDGGDGCDHCEVICSGPDAFVSPKTHHCYWIEGDKDSWLEARDACEDEGGHLAVVTSQAELDEIAKHTSEDDLWLGGGTPGSHVPFGWLTGEPWSFAPWKDDPPSTDDPTCVLLIDGPPRFEAKPCHEEHAYLCERDPPGKNP